MSVAKILEITSESKVSFEDAIRVGVRKAHDTVRNIQGAWVKEQKAIVKNGEVVAWRVDLKITFILD